MNIIKINGAYGEGGGQIIRTCLTLSAITKKSFEIFNIRAQRTKPGLQPQHLMACLAVNKLCHGDLQGAQIGSTSLAFTPHEITGGEYEFNIGTAGSVTLLAQTLIPICLFAPQPSHIRIIGGTHVQKSPGYDYFAQVFIPAIRKLGVSVTTKLIKAGYYPQGGGIIELNITPGKLHACCDWHTTEKSQAIIRLARLPLTIAQREQQILQQHHIQNIVIHEDDAYSVGNAVTVFQGFKGAYVLGERGKRAEIVAQEAFEMLQQEEGEMDAHLADQLLIYAFLAEGQTCFTTSRISEHFKTNVFVLSQFIDRKILFENKKVLIL